MDANWVAEVTEQVSEGSKKSHPRRGRKAKEKVENVAEVEISTEPLASVGKELREVVEQVYVARNEENIRLLSEVPKPFIEPVEKPYPIDAVDRMLPSPGFVTDFVNTGRGMESPTLFFFWNALWLISTVLRREAWLRWYPKPMWPNLYLLLVAPPALCRKSTSMDIATDLLHLLPYYMPTSLDAYKQTSRIVTGKATPEGIIGALEPQQKIFFDHNAEGSSMITVERGSQIAISISEFAVFLGKQQYNAGMVNMLLDLFDCKDSDSELTRGRGDKPLKDIYCTLQGGITPDGLKSSIPEEAFGGGFMSRLVMAYQDIPTKIYPIPKVLEGYPSVDDLRVKIAWIAMNAKGEYYLTPEAEQYYSEWYHSWKASLFVRGMDNKDEFRTDSLILRVAILLRAQEYRLGNDITLENIRVAHHLLEYTIATSKRATEDIGATKYSQYLHACKRAIQRRGSISRRELSQKMSPRGVSSMELTAIVEQLAVEGFCRITLNGAPTDRSSGSGKEIYEMLEETV